MKHRLKHIRTREKHLKKNMFKHIGNTNRSQTQSKQHVKTTDHKHMNTYTTYETPYNDKAKQSKPHKAKSSKPKQTRANKQTNEHSLKRTNIKKATTQQKQRAHKKNKKEYKTTYKTN